MTDLSFSDSSARKQVQSLQKWWLHFHHGAQAASCANFQTALQLLTFLISSPYGVVITSRPARHMHLHLPVGYFLLDLFVLTWD